MIEPRPSECQRAVVDIAIGIFEKSTMKLPHRRQFLHLAAGAAALPAVLRFQGRKLIHHDPCVSSLDFRREAAPT